VLYITCLFYLHLQGEATKCGSAILMRFGTDLHRKQIATCLAVCLDIFLFEKYRGQRSWRQIRFGKQVNLFYKENLCQSASKSL